MEEITGIEELYATYPIIAALLSIFVWFIISERKSRVAEREMFKEILLKNHDIIRDSQQLIHDSKEGLDDLRQEMREGFVKIDLELKEEYRSFLKRQRQEGGNRNVN